jgi:hypothetical protein
VLKVPYLPCTIHPWVSFLFFMETTPKDSEKHDSDKQHQIGVVLSEYSALRIAYQQAIDDLDAPLADLLIPHLAKPPSKLCRFMLSYHPYFTQKKFMRYFVEVHVRTRLGAIRKAFERLNRLGADEPFKSAVEGIERWLDDLQHPITLNGLLRISIPPGILFALTYFWKHFGPPDALDSISFWLTSYLRVRRIRFRKQFTDYSLEWRSTPWVIGKAWVQFPNRYARSASARIAEFNKEMNL